MFPFVNLLIRSHNICSCLYTQPQKKTKKKKSTGSLGGKLLFLLSFFFQWREEVFTLHCVQLWLLCLSQLFFFFCLSLFICSANSNPCEKVDSLFLFQLTNGRVPLSLSALCFIPERTNERTKKKNGYFMFVCSTERTFSTHKKKLPEFLLFLRLFYIIIVFFLFFFLKISQRRKVCLF